MKKFDVVILGCGASGTMCALSMKNKNVAVIDMATKPAKKLLVTGNGRCNLTNTNFLCKEKNVAIYNQNLQKFFERFDQKQTLQFFENLGLECFADEEGRVYPISNTAKSVVDVLTRKLEKNAQLFMGEIVQNIEKKEDFFFIKTDKDTYSCEKLVVATGGNTMVNTLKNLGVEVSEFTPSLVALKSKDIKDLNGIKISNVKVTATNNNGQSATEVGEVLFKDGGISGIVIFNLSTLFSRIKDFKGKIEIDLLPNMTHKQLSDKLSARKNLNVNMDKFFVGMFQNALANEIFRQAKFNTNINSNKLTSTQIEVLTKTIKSLQFSVYDCFDNNQVFSGGVKLQNLTENLMSKKINNLYFTGEICDVDGVCGGYNLQWAWTSGHIVGESLW